MQSNLDDLPVGSGIAAGGPSQTELDEFGGAPGVGQGPAAIDNSGPLEQRLVSKNWQLRANAF